MNFWKRLLCLFVGLLYFSSTSVAQAQSFTVLPTHSLETREFFPTERACYIFLDDFEDIFFFKSDGTFSGALIKMREVTGIQELDVNDVLACTIRTGRVKFAYINYYATYVLSLGSVLSGIVAMLFVVIGAFKYTLSGVTEDKDGAKSTIKYALMGVIVSLLSWSIVQIVLAFVSG